MELLRVCDGDLAAAFKLATAECVPVFVPASVYTDDRGWSIMNQFQGVLRSEGQINFSGEYPGVIKAWHRHLIQTDFWMCLFGHIKVGVYQEKTERCWQMVIGEKRPGTVIIPPSLWHGTTVVGSEPAGFLYYVTHSYNPANPDEQRRPYDSVPQFSWSVQHR